MYSKDSSEENGTNFKGKGGCKAIAKEKENGIERCRKNEQGNLENLGRDVRLLLNSRK